jgi:FkbM family methyltransferase
VPALGDALARHEHLVLERVAVAPRPSRVTLHLNPTRCASLHLVEDGAAVVTVDGVTLPDLLARHALEHVDLLKVDIEGAELAVFETTPDHTLLACDQVSVEFHDFLDPSLAPAVTATIRRFGQLGFACFRGSLTERDDMLFLNPRIKPRNAEMLWMKVRYLWLRGARRRARSLFER